MNRLIACILAAALMIPPPPARAAEKEDGVSYSYYLVPCGTFIKHKQNGPPSDVNNTADTFYIAGWISAYNRLKPENPIPDDTALDDIVLWLEQYCTDNPLSNLQVGLTHLSEEVKPRAAETPAPAPSPPARPAKKKTLPPAPPPAAVDPQPFHVPVQGLKPLPD